jgi:hypothetical protein
MNRKIRKLMKRCPEAVAAYIFMVSYSSDKLTDGRVDEDTALYVLDITDSALDNLSAVGLIESDGNSGYVIHDYLDWQMSKKQVEKTREGVRERTRKWRSDDSVTASHDDSDDSVTASHRTKHKNQEPKDLPNGKSNPLTPFDDPIPEGLPRGFANFWAAYPRHDELDAALREYQQVIHAPGGASDTILLAAAANYAAAVASDDPQYVKLAKNWLRDGTWRTRHKPRAPSQPPLKTDRASAEWDNDRRILAQLEAEEASQRRNEGGRHAIEDRRLEAHDRHQTP